MIKKIFGLIIVVLGLIACTGDRNPAEERARTAMKAKGDIIIGAAAPWSDEDKTGLWKGIEMAFQEINREGGVLGRKIQVIREDDEASVSKGQIIAQQFAENKNLIAVIGHYNSYITDPTSIIYQYNGILMLTPASTSPNLTMQGLDLVFRNIPNDNDTGRTLARFCAKQGYKNMLIYHAEENYGTGLANAFAIGSEENGINIPDRKSYNLLSSVRIFEKDLLYWRKNYVFDAIFLAGSTPQAAQIIRTARDLDITVPIIGGDGLDNPDLIGIAGEKANNTFIGTVFNPERHEAKTAEFIKAFSRKYKTAPDSDTALGYDAVHLLAHAIRKAGSAVPRKIADALRSTEEWEGVTGEYSFDKKGDVFDKELYIKEISNNAFKYYQVR